MFAIVDIAGTQQKVEKGARLEVPCLEGKEGDKLTFSNVLMIADGDSLSFGAPFVSGAAVEVKIMAHGRGDKIRVVKMRRRKRYRRVKGHRQGYTMVEVVGISTK